MLTRKLLRLPSVGSLLKILISVGLLGAVLYFVDFGEAKEILLNANPWYILAFVVLAYLDRALMAYKWNPLLVALNVRIPYFALFRMYAAAGLAGLLLPSTIGGDIFRVYVLSRYKVKAGAVISSIVIERVIGFVAMLVPLGIALVVAAFLFKDEWLQLRNYVEIPLIVLALALMVTWAIYRFSSKWIGQIVAKFGQLPIVGKILYIYSVFIEYRNHWRVIAKVFALTVLEQAMPIIAAYFLIRAFNIDIAIPAMIAIIPISTLAIRLPISMDGIGVHEGINVILFGLAGVSVAEVLLFTIASRILLMLCALPFGLSYILTKRAPVVERQEVERQEQEVEVPAAAYQQPV